ncbi:MAG: tRNA 2-thiouridine(34) synthase MnmA [Planctomycetes bacterium]|nr:tRNA 2-thiouridine(34) synthase MnmA [Planctomycetota bacterium]
MTTAVLLSGGVDSSVALRLLQEEGHDDLTAFYLKIWLEDELHYLGECPWEEDLADARAVCDAAGVPLEVVPLQRQYWDRVVSYTIAELKEGRTPSPDIFCNQRVKFGAFLEEAGEGFDRVATGHYARTEEADGLHWLKKGVDPVKDQTYFLCYLDQAQLARCVFPLGALPKNEVRALAERYGLPNSARPDSQGICFLGKISYNDFVRHHLGEKPGDIIRRETGEKLGEHRGFWFHTVGQRRGLGLAQGPWFVSGKDVEENIVYVSHADELPEASRSEYRIGEPHWISAPPGEGSLQVKLRHSEHVYECELSDPGAENVVVRLASTDAGIAAGQFTVFYKGDVGLGAAPILG